MDYRLLALILIVVLFIYHLIESILSKRSINKPIPECINDIYDEETYKKYRSYQKERDNYDIVKNIVSSIVDLALFASGLLNVVSESFTKNLSPYLGGLIVLVFYLLINLILIDIPFELYSTYKIEEKYGFNKTKGKTFVLDLIKNSILSGGLIYGLLALYIWLYSLIKLYSIIAISLTILIFVLVLNLLSPLLVNISYKKTPLEEGELRNELTSLLTKEGYQVKDIYVIDGSKRSTKANAFFTGIGKLKSIMLYDTLIDLMSPKEIVAVFAHEMGHGKHKDTIKNVIIGFFNYTLLISLLVGFTYLIESINIVNIVSNNYTYIFLFYMELILPIYIKVYGIISNHFSRKAEYLADKEAKDQGYGEELITALKKLGLNNYSNLTPNKFLVFMNYSHPTLEERILALKK